MIDALVLVGVLLWESPEQLLCSAVIGREGATDVIVDIFYEADVPLQDGSVRLLRSRTLTFPVFPGIRSMGECLPIRQDKVQKVRVRWLSEVGHAETP